MEIPVLEMPQQAQMVATCLFGALAAIAIGYSVKYAISHKVSYPLWLVLGILLSTPYEPHTALLGHFVYPQTGQWTAFTMHGIPMPWFLVLIYFVYIIPFVMFIFNAMERGSMTPSLWWKQFAVGAVGAFLFEPVAIHFGLWTYWGDNQPLKVLGLPLWWIFANPAGLMIMGICLYLIWRDLLGRKHTWSLALLMPMGLFTFLGGVSSPAHMMINSYDSQFATVLGSIGAAAISLFGIWVCQKLIEREQR